MKKSCFKYVLCISLYFLFAKIGFSQNRIIGKIVDNDGNKLEYVTVNLYKGKDAVKSTFTDNSGMFILNAENGEFSIRCKMFENILFDTTINVKNNVDLGTVVVNKTLRINEIKVKAYRKYITHKEDKIIFDVEKSLSSITASDALDILKQAPGVFVDSDNEINIRNKTATITINGQQIHISGTQLSDYLKSLNASDIKNIEIQSFASADMAANTDGGIININTKRIRGINFNVRTTDSYLKKGVESGNSTNVNYGLKNLNIYANYMFNIIHRDLKNVETYASSDFFENSQTYKQNIYKGFLKNYNNHIFRIGFFSTKIKKHSFGAEINYNLCPTDEIKDELTLINISKFNVLKDTGKEKNSYNRRNNFLNGFANYKYETDTIGSNFNVSAGYIRNYLNEKNNIVVDYDQNFYTDNEERNFNRSHINIATFKANYSKKFVSSLLLSAGLKYSHTNRNSDFVAEDYTNMSWVKNNNTDRYDYTENVFASYVLAQRSIGKKIFAKTALRMEYTQSDGESINSINNIKQNYTSWFPSVYFSYKVNRDYLISFSYGKYIYRPPFSLFNNYAKKQSDYFYDVGNPKLHAQYTNRFELSLEFANHTIAPYYTYIQNEVTEKYNVVDSVIYHTNINGKKVEEIGVGYNYNGEITNFLNLNILAFAFYKKMPQNLYKREMTSGTVNIQNNFKICRSFYANLHFTYKTPMLFMNYKMNKCYYFDFSLTKLFYGGNFVAKFGIDDIFNTQNRNITIKDFNYESHIKKKIPNRKISFTLIYKIQSKKQVQNIQNKNNDTELKNRIEKTQINL